MATEKTVYVCAWYAPRGFANEGCNYYGTLDQWREFIDERDPDPYQARWDIISHHRSQQAAQARAEKEVRISRRRIAWGEQDYTSAESLTVALAESF